MTNRSPHDRLHAACQLSGHDVPTSFGELSQKNHTVSFILAHLRVRCVSTTYNQREELLIVENKVLIDINSALLFNATIGPAYNNFRNSGDVPQTKVKAWVF